MRKREYNLSQSELYGNILGLKEEPKRGVSVRRQGEECPNPQNTEISEAVFDGKASGRQNLSPSKGQYSLLASINNFEGIEGLGNSLASPTFIPSETKKSKRKPGTKISVNK